MSLGSKLFLIPYPFSDVAFGGKAGNVLAFDPLQVQARPIPIASACGSFSGSEAAAGAAGALQVL